MRLFAEIKVISYNYTHEIIIIIWSMFGLLLYNSNITEIYGGRYIRGAVENSVSHFETKTMAAARGVMGTIWSPRPRLETALEPHGKVGGLGRLRGDEPTARVTEPKSHPHPPTKKRAPEKDLRGIYPVGGRWGVGGGPQRLRR